MADLQPPPTFADPVIVDERTKKGRFNPIWLKWFVDLAQTLNDSGGTTIDHNSLGGLQGGTSSQYYHLTSAQHGSITGTKTANHVFAGPTGGAPATPAFRALVAADLPGGTGTVTSVALTATPTSVFNVSGSPVTTTGTLALSMDDQSANTFLAGPTTGAAATPAFRTMVAADFQTSGTWTPDQGAGVTVVGAFSSSGSWIRTGNQMTVNGRINGATSVALTAGGAISSNLPVASTGVSLGTAGESTLQISYGVATGASSTISAMEAIAATPSIYFTVTYFV
jgi:hypothetical protein